MANSSDQQKPGGVTRRGLLLKQAREEKGISIDTVHEMTKIPLDVLHAIEEGYTVRMVSAYYFKGFIKMYAKFLGLDSTLVLDEPLPVKAVVSEPVSVVSDPEHRKFNEYITRQSKKQMIISLILAGLFALVSLLVFLIWGNMSKNHLSPKVLKVNKVQKVKPSSKMLAAQSEDRKMLEKTKAQVRVAASPKKQDVPKVVAPISNEAVDLAAVEEKKVASSTNKVSLSIKSRAAGWLQVKVDGNMVFQSTLRAGAVESWQADQTIELSGKNINNLEFEVNGKVLGQLGKTDRRARRVIITKDGLTVKN
jgi:cytoskeletal protein RodZ